MSNDAKQKRHRWGDVERRDYGYTARICADCRVMRIQRFNRGHHWTEWMRKDGSYIDTTTTPPCEPDAALSAVRGTEEAP